MPDQTTTEAEPATPAAVLDYENDIGVTGDRLVAVLRAAGYSIVPTHQITALARSFGDMPYSAGITPFEHEHHRRSVHRDDPIATIGDVLWTLDNLRARLVDAGVRRDDTENELARLRSDVAAVRRLFGTDTAGAALVASRQAKAIAENTSDALAAHERAG